MTFLSKLGQFLAKAGVIAGDLAGIWAGVGPVVSTLIGAKGNTVVTAVINDLTAVGKIVVMAEALIQGTGTGAQKLAAAAPLVQNIVQTSEMVAGHKIANEALFVQGCKDLTNAVVEILNSLDSSKVPNP